MLEYFVSYLTKYVGYFYKKKKLLILKTAIAYKKNDHFCTKGLLIYYYL